MALLEMRRKARTSNNQWKDILSNVVCVHGGFRRRVFWFYGICRDTGEWYWLFGRNKVRMVFCSGSSRKLFLKIPKGANEIKYKYNDWIGHETIVSASQQTFFVLLSLWFSTLKKQSSSASVNKVVFLDGRHSQNDISERRSTSVDRWNPSPSDVFLSTFQCLCEWEWKWTTKIS